MASLPTSYQVLSLQERERVAYAHLLTSQDLRWKDQGYLGRNILLLEILGHALGHRVRASARLHLPNVLGVLADGAVRAEFAAAGGGQDRHLRPLLLVH
eukprot:721492-Prorocentrum_minimum.AAC.1